MEANKIITVSMDNTQRRLFVINLFYPKSPTGTCSRVSVYSRLNWNLEVMDLWREENWRTWRETVGAGTRKM